MYLEVSKRLIFLLKWGVIFFRRRPCFIRVGPKKALRLKCHCCFSYKKYGCILVCLRSITCGIYYLLSFFFVCSTVLSNIFVHMRGFNGPWTQEPHLGWQLMTSSDKHCPEKEDLDDFLPSGWSDVKVAGRGMKTWRCLWPTNYSGAPPSRLQQALGRRNKTNIFLLN